MPSVLVTGANGFLGAEVCRTLLEDGMSVRGLTRTKDAPLEPGVIRFLAADLTDDRALRPAMEGADAVIHLAGRAHVVDTDGVESEIAFQHANVDGTQAVLDAAIRAGVRRFLFTSSIKVMGTYAGRPWTEEDVPAPADAYGRSKLAAERLLSQAAAAGNIELGIVRLPLVYGPGVKANMLQLFRLVEAGVPLPFKDTANRKSIVYSKNVAAALSALLAAARLGNETFFVTDAEAVSTPSLIRMIGHSLGKRPRLFSAPTRSLDFVARLGDSLGPYVQ
ncbi:MAG: NAD-dependent epimerase/dehydratase family protein, partial [Gemmatimonadaceae bacterium]|nr:NAD-dependent epimerase/dehydratase family protein [Gemmatimonadaceae bacterium]